MVLIQALGRLTSVLVAPAKNGNLDTPHFPGFSKMGFVSANGADDRHSDFKNIPSLTPPAKPIEDIPERLNTIPKVFDLVAPDLSKFIQEQQIKNNGPVNAKQLAEKWPDFQKQIVDKNEKALKLVQDRAKYLTPPKRDEDLRVPLFARELAEKELKQFIKNSNAKRLELGDPYPLKPADVKEKEDDAKAILKPRNLVEKSAERLAIIRQSEEEIKSCEERKKAPFITPTLIKAFDERIEEARLRIRYMQSVNEHDLKNIPADKHKDFLNRLSECEKIDIDIERSLFVRTNSLFYETGTIHQKVFRTENNNTDTNAVLRNLPKYLEKHPSQRLVLITNEKTQEVSMHLVDFKDTWYEKIPGRILPDAKLPPGLPAEPFIRVNISSEKDHLESIRDAVRGIRPIGEILQPRFIRDIPTDLLKP